MMLAPVQGDAQLGDGLMSLPTDTDRLFLKPVAQSSFSFDITVTTVFPDMIRRSVPGYEETLRMIRLAAGQYAQPHSHIYDMGCSWGEATLAAIHGIGSDPLSIHYHAIDQSPSMLERSESFLHEHAPQCPITYLCESIENTGVANASLVIMNYTLQFLPISSRLAILKKCCDGLNAGGAMILSEKTCVHEKQLQQKMDRFHDAYKRSMGYSSTEILNKRSALEKVLIPESIDTHLQRLNDAGFSEVYVLGHWMNFACILAIKP